MTLVRTFMVNFAIFEWMYLCQSWPDKHQTWELCKTRCAVSNTKQCGSCVDSPTILGLVPNPPSYELRQCQVILSCAMMILQVKLTVSSWSLTKCQRLRVASESHWCHPVRVKVLGNIACITGTLWAKRGKRGILFLPSSRACRASRKMPRSPRLVHKAPVMQTIGNNKLPNQG